MCGGMSPSAGSSWLVLEDPRQHHRSPGGQLGSSSLHWLPGQVGCCSLRENKPEDGEWMNQDVQHMVSRGQGQLHRMSLGHSFVCSASVSTHCVLGGDRQAHCTLAACTLVGGLQHEVSARGPGSYGRGAAWLLGHLLLEREPVLVWQEAPCPEAPCGAGGPESLGGDMSLEGRLPSTNPRPFPTMQMAFGACVLKPFFSGVVASV